MRARWTSPERAAGCLRRALAVAGVLSLAWLSAAHSEDEPERHLIFGTAPVAGIYYPAGGALCRLVNAQRGTHGQRCLVEATSGAEENLRRLQQGDLDFALIQSDWQYHAYRTGVGTDAQAPVTDLRAVLSLHALPFTLVVGPNGGIRNLEDLEGKRLNLGRLDSPWRAAADFLVKALGWQHADFAEIGQLDLDELAAGLCDDRIDAFLMPIAHPSGVIARAAETCGARLLNIEGKAVDRLLAEWSFYAPAVIPGGLYPHNPDAVRSFGLRATLVTSAAVPADVVYAITKAIFERLEALKAQHAAFAGLQVEEMISAGHSAPLHDGALRYYRERGWIATQ